MPILPAAAGQPQQRGGRPPHRPQQPHGKVVVQDLTGFFQQRAHQLLVVLRSGLRQAEQYIAAQHIGPGDIAGQIVFQQVFHHFGAGEAQFDLLRVGQCRTRRADLTADQKIPVRRKVCSQPAQRRFQLLFLLKHPGVQPRKKAVLVAAQSFGHAGGGRRLPHQRPFLFDPLRSPRQCCGKAFRRKLQLHQIIHRSGAHRLAHIVELLKTGQDDEHRQRAFFPAGTGQGKPIHQRHFHIRHHDIRFFLLDGLQRLAAVAGGAADGIAQLLPLQHPLQPDQYQRLIVRQ